jgi:hypothetical protein
MNNQIIALCGAISIGAVSWAVYIVISAYWSYKKDMDSEKQSQDEMKESMRHYD